MANNRAAILETCFECFGTLFLKKELTKYEGKQYCKNCLDVVKEEEERLKLKRLLSDIGYRETIRNSMGLKNG